VGWDIRRLVACGVDHLAPDDLGDHGFVVTVLARLGAQLLAEVVQFVVLGVQLFLGGVEEIADVVQGRQL
jgi:hypothetical protein